MERATYSKKAVQDCYKAIKAINSTVNVKAAHFGKACEIKRVYEMCEERVNPFVFDPDYGDIHEYFKMAYDFKKYTGKELKLAEKRALRYLNNEIEGIVYLMAEREVNVVA